MFGWLRKKLDPSPYEQLRGSILANEELAKVATYAKETDDEMSPWHHFAAANRVATTDTAAAVARLRQILALPNLESRTILQTWHCLRTLGVAPDASLSRKVCGIVVEVGLDAGLDALAAYEDHSARYFNHSGATVIWDITTEEMNGYIDPFLEVAKAVCENTAPFDQPHPAVPDNGNMLINILTPNGIHIGMGPMDALQRDPMGSAVIQTALALMKALMSATK